MTREGQKAIYAIIRDRVLEALNKGVIPWLKPWKGFGSAPRNIASKKPYRGINVWMLLLGGYDSPWFGTFHQWKALGGSVRKGEKAHEVFLWKPKVIEVDDEDRPGEKKKIKVLFIRYFKVFNAEQVDGIEDKLPKLETHEHEPLEAAEDIVRQYAPKLAAFEEKFGSGNAYYSPLEDRVSVPDRKQFTDIEHFYSTVFHEFGHSTGHKDRLNRAGVTDLHLFGDHEYSNEELIAEFTASFLCGTAGIERTVEASASYIDHWSKVIAADVKILTNAASQAQRAADFVLGLEVAEEAEAA